MNAYILIKKVASLGLLGLSIAAASAQAQNYPTKPIRFLVGFGPGGPTDVVARVLGNAMSQLLGQPIVVENRAGADSLIATQAVARADPDGYLLLIASGSHSINASLYPETKVDPVKDFSHIGMIGDAANFLVVHPSVPANNADEFLKLLRDNPGKYNSGTTASTTFLATQLFQTMAGVDTQNIPYKGAGPGTLALVAGEIQMSITSLVGMLPQVKANKVKPLAVTSATRSPLAPDVPTLTEKALPGYVASTWYAMFAPANTPVAIVDLLNQTLNKVMSNPDIKKQLQEQGMVTVPMSPAELQKFVAEDTLKWAKVTEQGKKK
ncbi:MAG: tripartite tricarboxylate transporter substrate binding protein [Zwartia sp.]